MVTEQHLIIPKEQLFDALCCGECGGCLVMQYSYVDPYGQLMRAWFSICKQRVLELLRQAGDSIDLGSDATFLAVIPDDEHSAFVELLQLQEEVALH